MDTITQMKQRFSEAQEAETWVKLHANEIEKKVTYRAAPMGARVEDFCGWQAQQDEVFPFITHYRNKTCEASLLTPSTSVRIYPGVAKIGGYVDHGYVVCEETTIEIHGLVKRTTQWFFFSQKNRFVLNFSKHDDAGCEFKCDGFKYITVCVYDNRDGVCA